MKKADTFSSAERLSLLIGNINDDLILKADTFTIKKAKISWRVYSGVAAAFAVCIIGIAFGFAIGNRGIIAPPCETAANTSITDTQPPVNTSDIIGLSVNHFCLGDLPPTGDRLWYTRLDHFLSQGRPPRAFAFVRVIETELSEYAPNQYSYTSAFEVLSTIWSDDSDIPAIISITQGVPEGGIAPENYISFLPRKGGVYLLPLGYFDDWWYIIGDMDVLFEVDDTGKVWSHSPFADFKQFDGESATLLAQAIKTLTTNNF
jgi:hypothetical protein